MDIVSKIIKIIIKVVNAISGAISDVSKFKEFFKITGIFATRKFKPAKKQHKYAILVAARNEEAVIGKLIESIRCQDYPEDLVSVFVCADNCTDNTAAVARENGAICYERFDPDHRTKGFALQYLVECIRRDYGIHFVEGYIIFDADNLLKGDFISRMNDSFDAGEKIVTSYRNTKNFGDNWISASYGLHWLRTVRNEHRARSIFRLATRIQGTGFLFASEIIENGWNYTSLTEDRAFCADAVVNGYKISYNNDAQFYDEQPTDIKIAMRQRIRWSKGHLQAFTESGGMLFKHIFVTGGAGNLDSDENTGWFIRLVKNLRLRFMSLDMLLIVYPRAIFSIAKKILIYFLRLVLIFGMGMAIDNVYFPKFFTQKLGIRFTFGKGITNFLSMGLGIDFGKHTGVSAAALLLAAIFLFMVDTQIKNIVTAAYVFIFERKRIEKISFIKKVWFCITFPIFDIIGRISFCIALFSKAEWKPIPHKAAIGIEELTGGGARKPANTKK